MEIKSEIERTSPIMNVTENPNLQSFMLPVHSLKVVSKFPRLNYSNIKLIHMIYATAPQ